MSKNDLVEIDIEIKRETGLAFLVTDGDVEAWLPKSKCYEPSELMLVGKTLTVKVPEWLAVEKEMV